MRSCYKSGSGILLRETDFALRREFKSPEDQAAYISILSREHEQVYTAILTLDAGCLPMTDHT
jgi:hypothetical protein